MASIYDARTLGCYSEAIEILDEEFVFSKGRSISLAMRMPHAYGSQNADNIFCAVERNVICGVLVARRFEILLDTQWTTGYMIGGVVTKKEFRNQGIASRLLFNLGEKLLDASFFILWTGIPDFYKRLGWRDAKRGIWGQFKSRPDQSKASNDRVIFKVFDKKDLPDIDIIRRRSTLAQLRDDDYERYAVIPLPANNAGIFMENTGCNHTNAYAAVGINGETAYIYELLGEIPSIKNILNQMCNTYATVYFNADDVFEKNLVNMGAHEIKAGPSALLKTLTPKNDMNKLNAIYFSYLDRI
jgi:predicted N-acetyltransferase YhbS